MTEPSRSAPGGATGGVRAACAGVAAVGVATFCWLRPANFRGYDEWMVVWALSRRIVSVPYANRPLGFVWHVPAWLLAPDRLWGFLAVHACWLTCVGVLTCLLARRLVPNARLLAFVAGVFAVVWMPSEATRVASIQMALYSGFTAGAMLATWLFAEAWCRRRPAWLVPAAVAAAAAAFSHEAVLPVLAAAPFLLFASVGRGDLRRWLAWTAGALAFVAALVARAAVPLLRGGEALAYQMDVLGGRRPPSGVLRQLGLQLELHLRPLAATPLRELAAAPVAVVVLVFLLAFAVVAGRLPTQSAAAGGSRLGLVAVAGAGLAHAVLAYLPFVITRAVRGAVRTEFLAAPGIAVFLAAAIVLAGTLVRGRARPVLVLILASWPVAVGTARTLAAQRDWDEGIAQAQLRTLRQLTALAPALRPHTLVVLLQNGRTWTFDFSFSKAIEYLYEDDARGFVPGTDPFLLETRFDADGVSSEPAASVRAPWHDPVERYRYDELIVFAEDAEGRLSLLRSWPEDLDPLPAGSAYAPLGRILAGAPGSRRLAILDGVG